MDKEDKPGGSGGLITLVLIAAGVFFVARAPLDSSRPALSEPHPQQYAAAQDVDARLWEDPFGAVAKAREAALKSGGAAAQNERANHSEARFKEELQRLASRGGRSGAVVLAATLPGGPYAEQAESRRRTRYAILAGLSSRGFAPQDDEHLGYFYTEDDGGQGGAREIVAYESFATQPGARNRSDDCNDCGLVVLWLNSSGFYDRPLRKLVRLAGRLAPDRPGGDGAVPPVRWRVLGPSTSDGLRAVVEEAAREDSKDDREQLQRHDLRLFSPAATVPDAALLRGIPVDAADTVSSYLEKKDVLLLRTIGTDDRLAFALVHELELRGLRARPSSGLMVKCPQQEGNGGDHASPKDLPSSIAIVSEWDTLYGRSLRQQFRYDPATDKAGFCVTRWHYLRGIDGRLPDDSSSAAAEGRSKKDAKADSADRTGRDGASFERPEGRSQYDYLRRLAADMRAEDARLRERYGREYGIRAVGVLGNDVYDKLLVLQALQSELPHAIFFTTDLDARMSHPREQAWARNLIVASNFGLRLYEPLQRGFAPFRDSYQPSAYLSTLLAMADVGQAIDHAQSGAKGGKPRLRWSQAQLNAWFEKPRVFEVSRSGVFDFSDASAAVPAAAASAAGAGGRCSPWRLETCASIHPPGSPMAPDLSLSTRYLIATAIVTALWLPYLVVSRGGRRRLRRIVSPSGKTPRWLRWSALVAAFVTLTLWLPLWLSWSWPAVAAAITHQGKPLSITEGISPWPTYAIRLATLVLCLYFVAGAWSSLRSNLDRIAQRFRLGATRRHLRESLAAEQRQAPRWRRLGALFAVRFYRQRPPRPDAKPAVSAATIDFWKHYIVQNRASARLLRTSLGVVVMIVLFTLIDHALGGAPVAPERGDLTHAMQRWSTIPAALAAQFLIFFVVDATLLCVLFVRGLNLHHSSWPPRTQQMFSRRTGVPVEYLDEWIDLEFIGRRTRCIGTLIYYPFIVLSLMLVARSAFFDDWYSPPSLIVLASLSFAIVLLCAFALRRVAETSRNRALDRMRDAILRAKGAGHKDLADQLVMMRDRITQLREGAFAPYMQQPLLKAILMPILTVGGSSLIDYLQMVNF